MTHPGSHSPSSRSTPRHAEGVIRSERGATSSTGAAFGHARVAQLERLQKKWTAELEPLVRIRPDLAFHLTEALEDLATMIGRVKQQGPETRLDAPTDPVGHRATDRSTAAFRADQPLPGDLVIRPRDDASGLRAAHVFVITLWPNADSVVGGPYQSFGYALRQARGLLKDPSDHIWRDHSGSPKPEQLENVSADR